MSMGRTRIVLVLALGFVGGASSSARAQVVLDGTVGSMGPLPLAGPDYEVTETMGDTLGAALFHSFSQFSCGPSESVSFTLAPASPIENIFARVTGESASLIGGRLNSPRTLFLLNPHGLVFGPHSEVNVHGSLHASTADYLAFPNGERFEASADGARPLLAVAEPKAFGFLDADVAPIQWSGSFGVVRGGSVSVIGGAISIPATGTASAKDMPGVQDPGVSHASGSSHVSERDARSGSAGAAELPALALNGPLPPSAAAPGAGRVDVVAVASPGEVGVASGDGVGMNVSGFSRFASIAVSRDLRTAERPVFIRGGELVVSGDAQIGSTAGVDIEVDRLSLRDAATISNWTYLTDSPGDITIKAREAVEIRGATDLSLMEQAMLGMLLPMPGISAPGLFFSTDKHTVSITAPRLTIERGYIDTAALGWGPGGDVVIDVDELHVLDSGYIAANTSDLFTMDTGRGGDIRIQARSLFELSGPFSRVNSSTTTRGDPGSLTIDVGMLRISDGGNITSGPYLGAPFATGSGGDILIRATDGIEITGSIDAGFTGISATSYSASDAGNVTIRSPRLVLGPDGAIEAATFFSGKGGTVDIQLGDLTVGSFARIASSTSAFSTGDGGDVNIDATNVNVVEGQITATSRGRGDAGDVNVAAKEEIRVDYFGDITTEATNAFGGNISVSAGALILLDTFSEISSSVQAGEGDGGNVSVSSPMVILLQDSDILAQASVGNGGNILLDADLFIMGPDTTIDASSELGIAGNIDIHPPVVDIEGALKALPAEFFDSAELIKDRCSQWTPGEASRFVMEGPSGLPASAEEALPAFQTFLGQQTGGTLGAYAGTTRRGAPVFLAVQCGK